VDGKKPEVMKNSTDFEYGERKVFRAELEMSEIPNKSNVHLLKLRFITHDHGNVRYHPDEVTFFTTPSTDGLIEPVQMSQASFDQIWNSIQQFTITSQTRSILVTFYVKHVCTVGLVNKFMDSDWSGELWAAAVNRKMTDVEFFVGEESFGAHRSLLSARSPVFAAMFASGMMEAETGQVRIEDVDPNIFGIFLEFLYTGTFEPSPNDVDLFTVADKYQINTLMDLCRPANYMVGLE